MSLESFIIWLLLAVCDIVAFACLAQIKPVPGNMGYKVIGIIASLVAIILIILGMGIAGNLQPPV